MKPRPKNLDDNFSIVVPFYNEEPNVHFVLTELRTIFPNAEIVAVDDGSADGTWSAITKVESVRGLRLVENCGQSAAMLMGLQHCTREVCGLMDGDGQNDPAGFLVLLEQYYQMDVDVVCGYRATRKDTWDRRIASKIANAIRRSFLRDQIRDTGCSQKVFHRQAVQYLFPFNTMHRYLAALFRSANLTIVEAAVNHRPRRAGVSKYGIFSRALVGIHDLIGVSWLLKRRILPVKTEYNEPRHP